MAKRGFASCSVQWGNVLQTTESCFPPRPVDALVSRGLRAGLQWEDWCPTAKPVLPVCAGIGAEPYGVGVDSRINLWKN